MEDIYKDIEGYPRIWRIILENVMGCSKSQIDQWMTEHGDKLIADPAITLHEEPWFWLCSAIVNKFASTSKAVDFRRSENTVFFILANVFSQSEEDVDWDVVRRECKAAIVYSDPQSEG